MSIELYGAFIPACFVLAITPGPNMSLFIANGAVHGARAAPCQNHRPRLAGGGAAASLSNPKVLLFLGAFFPQFIDPASPAGPQLALLAVTFVLTIAAVDCTVAAAAGSARAWFTAQRRRLAEGVSGVLLVCGGLWLAAARRA